MDDAESEESEERWQKVASVGEELGGFRIPVNR
jgi:hypothetical protein